MYWCQGGSGCSVPAAIWSKVWSSSTSSSSDEGGRVLELRWHEEPGFQNREIPCSSFNTGHNTRKYSEFLSSVLKPTISYRDFLLKR